MTTTCTGNTSGSPPTANDLYNGNPVGSPNLNAKNNYWGTTDPGVIEDHIWHYPDDWDLGRVDYIPFRTTPVGPTPAPTPSPSPTPAIPNLSVIKLSVPDRVYRGEALTYLMILDNSGPTGITVALTDTIPAGASYITNTVWGGAAYSPTINSVLWSGTVSPEASTLPSQVLQFRVRIDPDVSTNAIANTALVSDGAVTTTASVMTEVWRRTFAPLVVKQASGW